MTAIRDEVDQLSATHRRQFEQAVTLVQRRALRPARHAGHDPGDVVLLLTVWTLVRRTCARASSAA